jgi:hypothetical protein
VTRIVIHCIPEPGIDPAEVASELKTYLQDTEGANPVVVKVEQPHVGLAEVLAIVQLANAAIDLPEKLGKFIESRRNRAKVKDIQIEIDGKRIPIGRLTPDQRRRLAAAVQET